MDIKIPDNPDQWHLTPFQWKVLKAVMAIPLGETRSYAWVAQKIGHPGAVRAVGTALRKNPFPLLIPCHRVIKSDGQCGKYAGRDDGSKKILLAIERVIREQTAGIGVSAKKTSVKM